MKVIVAGSREINSYDLVKYAIEKSGFDITEIVSGAARGVDFLGEKWANENNVPLKKFPADWDKHGKRAGFIRNKQMAEYSDALVAVLSPFQSCRGTKHMIAVAKQNGLPISVTEEKMKIKQKRKPIGFWTRKQSHFFLSNFYKAPFDLDGKRWSTSEHYYQAMKSTDEKTQEMIRMLATPKMAASEGRSIPDLRSDWEDVKEDVMRKAIYAKFSQNDDIRMSLLMTEDAHLFEDSPYDSYWGVGSDKSGLNRLGILLMELRDNLRKEKNG